eukprot:GHVL01002354.1.p1 GENE.GHVL01002354.1~~GHVL01002354.1.p1  ORF type:complete len:291 (+),score=57.19 GHVL01002354.1:753-1625(+)
MRIEIATIICATITLSKAVELKCFDICCKEQYNSLAFHECGCVENAHICGYSENINIPPEKLSKECKTLWKSISGLLDTCKAFSGAGDFLNNLRCRNEDGCLNNDFKTLEIDFDCDETCFVEFVFLAQEFVKDGCLEETLDDEEEDNETLNKYTTFVDSFSFMCDFVEEISVSEMETTLRHQLERRLQQESTRGGLDGNGVIAGRRFVTSNQLKDECDVDYWVPQCEGVTPYDRLFYAYGRPGGRIWGRRRGRRWGRLWGRVGGWGEQRDGWGTPLNTTDNSYSEEESYY